MHECPLTTMKGGARIPAIKDGAEKLYCWCTVVGWTTFSYTKRIRPLVKYKMAPNVNNGEAEPSTPKRGRPSKRIMRRVAAAGDTGANRYEMVALGTPDGIKSDRNGAIRFR